MVAWNNYTTGTIQVSRVSAAGVALDSGVNVTIDLTRFVDVAVSYGGGAYSVFWDGGNGGGSITAARVSVGATVIATTTGLLAGYQPAAAFDGTNHLLVDTALTDVGAGNSAPNINLYDIEGTRVTATVRGLHRARQPPLLVSGGANLQGAPAVAYNGTDYLAAWTDHRSGAPRRHPGHLRRALHPRRDGPRHERPRDLAGDQQPARAPGRLERHRLAGGVGRRALRREPGRHLRRARQRRGRGARFRPGSA